MSPDEVVQELKSRGVSVSRKTIYNWEKAGLIPEATFRNSRTTDYPPETPAEAYATHHMKYGTYRLKNETVAKAREKALAIEKTTSIKEHLKLVWDKNNEGTDEGSFWSEWLTSKLLALDNGEHLEKFNKKTSAIFNGIVFASSLLNSSIPPSDDNRKQVLEMAKQIQDKEDRDIFIETIDLVWPVKSKK